MALDSKAGSSSVDELATRIADKAAAGIFDGGAAFPFVAQDEQAMLAHPGMSLRDWFAGGAMQGFMLGLAEPLVSDRDTQRVRLAIENTTRLAYLVANAMLRERERK